MKKYLVICKTTENQWEISRQSVRHFDKVKLQPHRLWNVMEYVDQNY